MANEQTLHQAIMRSGLMTGVGAKRVEEEVIAWFADEGNSLAERCMELIKANAEVAERWMKEHDRVVELEDALVTVAGVALDMEGAGAQRIVDVVKSMAREE